MPTYQQADADARDLLAEVRAAYHPELTDAEVSVGLLFARGTRDEDGKLTSPAITHHGSRALGLARIVNLRDRASGMPDAMILVDGDEWGDWDDARRRAVLDHELTHLVVKTDDEGDIKTDDLGRPALKMRPHDFEVGWFREVAERHGADSVEAEQASMLVDVATGQLLMPWAAALGDLAPAPAARRKKAAVAKAAGARA